MKDFRIVHAKAILKVHSVAPVRGFLPPSVLVVGEKLDRTLEVLYNGIAAKEYFISSPNRLVVRIPPSQVGRELRDIEVLSTVSLTKLDAVVSLEITKPPKVIEGVDRLVQQWLMIWASAPGSDLWNPQSGGGGYSIIGRSTDKTGKNVAADLAQSVERTKSELLRIQAANPRIPPAERLLSSELQAVQFDPAKSELFGRVSIKNLLGEDAEISLR